MSDRGRGGRIPPDGRPSQAKGVGKNTKRHDLERPATPGLHDSDLQQGDVQALEEGQRIAPKKTMQPAGPQTQTSGARSAPQAGGGVQIPDAIDFIGSRASGSVGVPTSIDPGPTNLDTWMPILRQLASGPGSSGLLGSALINQVRQVRQQPREAVVIDFQDIDAGLEAMLDEGV